jgi:hypothetical protein
MLAYEHTPGETFEARRRWPTTSLLDLATGQPTLLMFVHPLCPCSRASLAELEKFAAQFHDRVAMRIIFVQPPNKESEWDHTDLWSTAERIPGAVLHRDTSGAEAARFEVTTSGETLLYSSQGALLFHGGMTASRGHQGENAGRTAISDLIGTGQSDYHKTPVFGCALFNHVSPSEDLPYDEQHKP